MMRASPDAALDVLSFFGDFIFLVSQLKCYFTRAAKLSPCTIRCHERRDKRQSALAGSEDTVLERHCELVGPLVSQPRRGDFLVSASSPATMLPMATAPSFLDALAQGNPAASLASLYDTVEVRTSITPPIFVSLVDALSRTGPASWQPNPFVQFIKPTVVFSGQQGRVVVAPYGEAGDGTALALLSFAGLVGLGVLIGRWSKK
jgi:hypothetical protein